jgi:hypothetical protein
MTGVPQILDPSGVDLGSAGRCLAPRSIRRDGISAKSAAGEEG